MTESSTSTTGSDSSTTSVSSSPGGTSTPSSTPDSRPATFRDAIEQQQTVGDTGPPTDDPATTITSPLSTPAPARAEPGTIFPAADPHATPAKGPIPYERHEAVLQSTRDKTTREVVSRVQQQFGPAIEFQQRVTADPVGAITNLLNEAVSHPDLGPQIVSAMARALSARRTDTAALEPIQTDAGDFYSAEQVQQLIDRQIGQRLQPFEEARAQSQQAQDAQRQHDQTVSTVQSRLAQWNAQPGFQTHASEIAEQQAAFVAQGADTWTALGLAYATVVPKKLQAQQTTQQVQDAARKAAASTGHPGTVSPMVRPRPKTFRESLERVSSNTL